MATLDEDLTSIKAIESGLANNKVARFAYTAEAYARDEVLVGHDDYDPDREDNIPSATPEVMKVNQTVIDKGYRAQASSITRMLMNHFLGRLSYNVNKLTDNMLNLLTTLKEHLGTANGVATLDENGRIPYSQLPESAIEYKGNWDANTNTPTLADGTGTNGDFYIVSVAGTQDLGNGDIQFFVNDRVIYDGAKWSRLSAGDVKTVNSVSPVNGNVSVTGEDIAVSSAEGASLLSNKIAEIDNRRWYVHEVGYTINVNPTDSVAGVYLSDSIIILTHSENDVLPYEVAIQLRQTKYNSLIGKSATISPRGYFSEITFVSNMSLIDNFNVQITRATCTKSSHDWVMSTTTVNVTTFESTIQINGQRLVR